MASPPSISSPDWSKLPAEILCSILQQLTVVDCVRFGAVCFSWRSAARQMLRPPKTPSPWLLATATKPSFSDGDDEIRCFYSFPGLKKHLIRVPELRYGRCFGSSHGWLVVVNSTAELRLVNPLTGAVHGLPRFKRYHDTYDGQSDRDGYDPDDDYCMAASFASYAADWYFVKAAVSLGPAVPARPPPPSPGGDKTVVMIYGNAMKLAFTREGDESWTELETPLDGFSDATFHDGRVFAVTFNGTAVACDLSDPSHPVVTCVASEEVGWRGKLWERNHQYLVGAPSGKLFLV